MGYRLKRTSGKEVCVFVSFLFFFFVFLPFFLYYNCWVAWRPDLIAFAWGRSRVSEAGVHEELFNPAFSGCFDRIVRLHRCYHTLRLYACRLKKCASYLIYWFCVDFPFESHTASCNQGTCRRKIFLDPAAYTISVLGWE